MNYMKNVKTYSREYWSIFLAIEATCPGALSEGMLTKLNAHKEIIKQFVDGRRVRMYTPDPQDAGDEVIFDPTIKYEVVSRWRPLETVEQVEEYCLETLYPRKRNEAPIDIVGAFYRFSTGCLLIAVKPLSDKMITDNNIRILYPEELLQHWKTLNGDTLGLSEIDDSVGKKGK